MSLSMFAIKHGLSSRSQEATSLAVARLTHGRHLASVASQALVSLTLLLHHSSCYLAPAISLGNDRAPSRHVK